MKITREMRQATMDTVNAEYEKIVADSLSSAKRWQTYEKFAKKVAPACDEIIRRGGSVEAWESFERIANS